MMDDAISVASECAGRCAEVSYGAMVFEVHPHRISTPHRHVSEEVWMVRSGVGRALIGGETRMLTPGQVISVGSCLEHSIINESDFPLVIISMWWRSH